MANFETLKLILAFLRAVLNGVRSRLQLIDAHRKITAANATCEQYCQILPRMQARRSIRSSVSIRAIWRYHPGMTTGSQRGI